MTKPQCQGGTKQCYGVGGSYASKAEHVSLTLEYKAESVDIERAVPVPCACACVYDRESKATVRSVHSHLMVLDTPVAPVRECQAVMHRRRRGDWSQS